MKAFGQKRHWKGFSPVWILVCLVRLDLDWNVLWQMLQGNGFLWFFCVVWGVLVECVG